MNIKNDVDIIYSLVYHVQRPEDVNNTVKEADQIIQFIIFAVSGVVFTECPHEDHTDQPHQEYHHHE